MSGSSWIRIDFAHLDPDFYRIGNADPNTSKRYDFDSLNRNVHLPYDFLFWNISKRFGFVPIISFDIGMFVLPFWYR